MKYVVTAATGNLGQTAVKELNKLVGAENVIVIARNTDKATKLFLNNEVRHGDYEDKSSMIDALKGIDRVLFISSQPSDKVDRATAHANVVDALKENNIKFVAYTSFPDAQNSTTPLATDHRLTENAIKEAGIDHSFLRDNWYLENEIGFLQSGAANHDALYWANNKAGWALERDYAEGAAKVLTSEDPREIYEFAGKTRTYDELGKALQEATGNHFAIKQISHDDYVKSLEEAGLDTPTAELFASFQAPIDSGSLNKESNDLEEVLGHPVTPLVDAIKEVLAR
ncbi:SDR family oxidoreductase [Limosilactobacillus reuteri]|uniref:SDR family oxidoreductase n=1 Tax=Limosilactobacillus reuteri TaxID=1598 RepID=UPI001E4FA778|nr:SDR family oxidoreductase [Limosilactobacillus reuteri]MCC4325491.1 SDR family oxidoreductase [Limosilactobacillus reuteri]MCC4329210.1 SDR family oxidoreductase [Limosilactobacillus reuteri]MCC4352701.1 SDR family oxidoreductase [Limosilactobacillus reuteri]MCC4377473.1 SDR family oxidoreductase [Limosilactobacillus reuteri]